jgi:hypothetical protein
MIARGATLAFTLLLALCASAAAQAAPAAAPATPPVEPAAPAPAAPASEAAPNATPAPSALPAASAPPATACLPACRSGFTCVHATCVSACNPACAAGETCSENGECIAPTPESQVWAGPRFFATPQTPPTPARARDPSAERHDGVMLRGTFGFGGISDVFDTDAGSEKHSRLSGGGAALSFDVGGAVAENTIVHARLASLYTSDPHVRIDGANYDQDKHDYTAALLLAPAVTYYFMPANVYLTGAFGLSWVAQRYHDSFGDRHTRFSSAGPGFNVDVGKEWWGADQIGVGLAGRFWYSRISDETSDGRFEHKVAGGALLLSVTYQ